MTQGRSRRLAAVWFADVVGYTQLAARDEDLALRVVRELQRLARLQCDARGGRLVKLLGDAVLTVFDSADGALRAAIGLRDAFLRSPEVQQAGVSLRVGLHLGDVAEAHDGDVYGDAVNAASRIQQVAGPGQVVLSAVAHQLLQQRATLQVEDLGEHELKGLGLTRLYAASLSGEGEGGADLRDLLQEELAPLQLLDAQALGGMGEIYLARDPRLRRTLAVKVLRSELASDREARARFSREAQVVAGLSHPNIIGIHSVGELKDGTPYFVMDHVEGGSLADRLEREGPLTVRETKRIVGEVASALAAAHARGVVHRDVKPSNILFDGKAGRALVSDWGIAALDPTVHLSPETRLTTTGTVIGSPQYMSPEQLAGDEVGPESDVYSLGLLAHELLTGKGPFPAESPRALMIAHLRDEPPRLSTLRADVDPELEGFVARCLSKNPDDRLTAEEIAGTFAPGAGEILEWPPPGLEPIRGAVFKYLTGWALLVGTVATPILLALLARASPDVARELLQGTRGSLVMIAALLAGLAALAGMMVVSQRQQLVMASWNLKREVAEAEPLLRALGLGYGWRTILEVALDRWGDHGNLLTGQREYAVLDARGRARTRRLVLWRGLLLVAATTLLPFGFLGAAAAIARRWMPAPWAVVLFAGLPLALWVATLLLPTEPQSVKRARLALARGRGSGKEVREAEIQAWQQTLAKVTRGLGPGPGRATTRRWYWAGQAVAFALVALPYAYALTVLVVAFVGGLYELPARSAGQPFERLRASAHLRLAQEPSITPAEARALLSEIDRWSAAASPWRGAEPSAASLGSSSVADPGSSRSFGLLPGKVIPAALGGLSPGESAFLAAFLGDPRLDALDRLARASGYDPGRAEAPAGGLAARTAAARHPGLAEVAVSRIAGAAVHVAEGRTAAAEEALRAVYSAGYLVAAESNDLEEALSGRTVAVLGLDALRQLYLGSGRFDEAGALDDPAAAPPTGGSWTEWLERAEATVADSTQLRAVRLQTMNELVVAWECTSVEGIILGVPPALDARLSAVAKSLVRYPSEEALFLGTESSRLRWGAPAAGVGPSEPELDDPILLGAARLVGTLTGNPRFLGCAARSPSMR